MEIQPTSVHVGDPFEGEGTPQDTTVFAQLMAQLPPSGPKPFYSGHYVPKDTVIILRWTAFKVQGSRCVCMCVCVCTICCNIVEDGVIELLQAAVK